jgi:hypothetical protein
MVGIGLGVAALGQNLGMYVGPLLFGTLLETTTWAVAGYSLIPVCLIGVRTGWMTKIR